MSPEHINQRNLDHAIAIIGMHVRVPGAEGLEAFWQNLEQGKHSIHYFSDEELRKAGIEEHLIHHPDYVKASARLEDLELFDASFFDMTPREVEILDPQHRILLEGVWRALEHAGIDPYRYPDRIGLYAGVGFNGYLIHNILPNPSVIEQSGAWQLSISNDKDFAPTRIAYKLNLQGPAISINTACSTSLVATAMAASALLNYQCDTAIAGGCSLNIPQDAGYMHVPGGTLSADGTCRPFDAKGGGTVDGNGTATVVMKRYQDALRDGDTIYALITGFAINNDGSVKVGYTAPGVAGQADVIMEAMEMAGVQSDDIDFIETHGTATELGDTVEISALREAHSPTGSEKGVCYLGSVKSNIGHLDTAAGTAGLIKTVLALQHQKIPPTCHFNEPNPLLDLESSHFRINNKTLVWKSSNDKPRRAGVSSFGIGGTNAHLIVEEAPPTLRDVHDSAQAVFTAGNSGRPLYLFPLSAKSPKALVLLLDELNDHLSADPTCSLCDVAYTLQQGRSRFDYRVIIAASEDDRAELLAGLSAISKSIKQSQAQDTQGGNIRQQLVSLSLEQMQLIQHKVLLDASKEWLSGTEPDWTKLAPKAKKVALPGHPFLRSRYWIDPPASKDHVQRTESSHSTISSYQVVKIKDVQSWFYLPSWQSGLPNLDTEALKSRWLIFDDGSQVSKQLINELRSYGADIKLIQQTLFKENPDWPSVFQELGSWTPEKILITGMNPVSKETGYIQLFERSISFSSALQKKYFSEEMEVIVLARQLLEYSSQGTNKNSSDLTDDEHDEQFISHAATHSVVLGPLKVLPQECPNISTRFIDADDTVTITNVISAISSNPLGSSAILRGNSLRWLSYTPLPQPLPKSGESIIRHEGLYLITGGLGDIGLSMAAYLWDQYKAKLILTTRSALPKREMWESLATNKDPMGRKLTRLLELEKKGASIEVHSADVSDEEIMKKVVHDAVRLHGKLNGIIHAAGIVGEDSFVTISEALTEHGKEKNSRQFIPKVQGLEVIEKVLAQIDFDFCLVCSSLSPILGGLGFSAYAATNALVDAKISILNQQQPGKWISINWEGWIFDDLDALAGNTNSSAAELGMTASEGIQAFEYLLKMPSVERLVISSGDLNARIDQWVSKSKQAELQIEVLDAHPRPEHLGLYTAPSNVTQKKLTELWEQLLGIQGIGIHDSFFELGGNSLLLTQLVALIRRHFKADLTLSRLFEQPTVAEMAVDINSLSNANISEDRDEGFI
jgi:polyketide synthase PksJ